MTLLLLEAMTVPSSSRSQRRKLLVPQSTAAQNEREWSVMKMNSGRMLQNAQATINNEAGGIHEGTFVGNHENRRHGDLARRCYATARMHGQRLGARSRRLRYARFRAGTTGPPLR